LVAIVLFREELVVGAQVLELAQQRVPVVKQRVQVVQLFIVFEVLNPCWVYGSRIRQILLVHFIYEPIICAKILCRHWQAPSVLITAISLSAETGLHKHDLTLTGRDWPH